MIAFWILFILSLFAFLIITAKLWIGIYNKLQYWYTRAQRHFSDILVVLQQRYDNILALGLIADEYKLHEYTTFKKVIEARSRWSGDLTEDMQKISDIEFNYSKIHALLEQYPEIKADAIYKTVMDTDTALESHIRQSRVSFNYDAQRYNELTRIFPNNIIASVHNFREMYYLRMAIKPYSPIAIFPD